MKNQIYFKQKRGIAITSDLTMNIESKSIVNLNESISVSFRDELLVAKIVSELL